MTPGSSFGRPERPRIPPDFLKSRISSLQSRSRLALDATFKRVRPRVHDSYDRALHPNIGPELLPNCFICHQLPIKKPTRVTMPAPLPYKIAPSILAANFARLGDEVRAVLDGGADLVHFDVMDNHYVPNLSFGPLVCEALRKDGIHCEIDVHLMVKPVDRIIPEFAAAGATTISVHPEATEHLDRTLNLIRDQGCQAGLVLNPATPVAVLEHVLPLLDEILLMSVNPGFGGQTFIPYVLDKARAVRQRVQDSGYNVRIEIDGGINATNIAAAARAGVDTFVAGSAIFNAPDYAAAIRELRAALQGGGT